MVDSCHKCGFPHALARCENGCVEILRFRCQRSNDLRLICFNCYQMVADKRTEKHHKDLMALHERLVQMRSRLWDAEHPESAPKKAKLVKEEKRSAVAASSKRRAKRFEEPDDEIPWDEEAITP